MVLLIGSDASSFGHVGDAASVGTNRVNKTEQVQSPSGPVRVLFSVRQRRCRSKPRVGSVSERSLGRAPRRVLYTNGVTSLFFRFKFMIMHFRFTDLSWPKNDVTPLE